ncbi:MAG: Gldg family protein [Spirochaetes bacterium]|nr:Gldg family protein [Spirochaetota bacterium]
MKLNLDPAHIVSESPRYTRNAAFVSIGALFLAYLFLYAVPGYPTIPFWVILGIASVCTSAALFFNRSAIVDFFRMRAVQKMFSTVAYMVVVIAVLIVGYIVISNFPLRFDLTKTKSFTLAPQTDEVVRKISEKLQIKVSRVQADDPSSMRWKMDMLLHLASSRNRNIDVEYFDPNREPEKAAKYQATQRGELIFIHRDKKAHLFEQDLAVQQRGQAPVFLGEEKFAQTLYSLTENYKAAIYFTAGHDEYKLNDTGEQGYSIIKSFLESENYEVRLLETTKVNTIPDDAALIIVAGPRRAFSAREIAMLDGYLCKGGRMFGLYDPVGIQNNECNLDAFFSGWGFVPHRDFAVDLQNNAANPVYVIPQFTKHPAVAALRDRNMPACLFLARSWQRGNQLPGAMYLPLLTTPSGNSSWGETDTTTDNPRYNAGTDTASPLVLGMTGVIPLEGTDGAATNARKQARIAVIGDSDFAMNQAISGTYQYGYVFTGNKDLFLNVVAYLMNVSEKISIRPKQAEEKRLTLSSGQTKFIRIIVQLIIPLLFAAAGAMVWFARRR